jgi:hypothetical protein
MLAEMTSEEVLEWQAFLRLRWQKLENGNIAAEAAQYAKRYNR